MIFDVESGGSLDHFAVSVEHVALFQLLLFLLGHSIHCGVDSLRANQSRLVIPKKFIIPEMEINYLLLVLLDFFVIDVTLHLEDRVVLNVGYEGRVEHTRIFILFFTANSFISKNLLLILLVNSHNFF